MLREWKLNFVMINGEEHGSVDLGVSDEYISIPLQPINKKLYNRAKTKKEFKHRLEEDLEEREW